MQFKMLTLALALSLPTYANDDFDLTDLIPAKPGQAVENASSVQVKGDIIVGDDDVAAVQVAHQQLLEEDDAGIKMIQVGSGTGLLSVGTSDYQVYNNHNATLLSKRGAYTEALLIAKKQFVENFKGVEQACSSLANVAVDVIDTGNDSVANTAKELSESCKDSVSGSLAGYVTFDVFDDIEEKMVRVSLISTPKTRSQIRKSAGAVTQTTNPSAIFKNVVNDLRKGVLPPVGAKVITHAETGEVVLLGFGSAIIRSNKNKSVARKLKNAAKKQSESRARSALLGTLKGDKVYWQGSFDEAQFEGNKQFEYDPETLDPTEAKALDEEQAIFVNQFKQSDAYSVTTAGRLPPGVNTKNFISNDGFWQYTIAVYSPSLEKAARKANKEMTQALSGKPSKSGNKLNAYGGRNENGKNSQAASGQVSKTKDL